ncbi:hypothetical protein Bca52824_030445 [Brassica carinata]|uniref:Uncharacterized protein n=1 Tax=Brassica carinata TaxID=52824 RepID=A0A8X7SD75_BRACI|nr:hypothetical protein Bca52824_030445 [Brassica carinata]
MTLIGVAFLRSDGVEFDIHSSGFASFEIWNKVTSAQAATSIEFSHCKKLSIGGFLLALIPLRADVCKLSFLCIVLESHLNLVPYTLISLFLGFLTQNIPSSWFIVSSSSQYVLRSSLGVFLLP